MDELAALKLIFRNNLVECDGSIVIKNQMTEYSIDSKTMMVDNPSHSYVDVYDYILRDIQIRAVKANAEITETYEAVPEYEKITEEQFYNWQKERQFTVHQNPNEGPNGREIWMAGAGHVDDEE